MLGIRSTIHFKACSDASAVNTESVREKVCRIVLIEHEEEEVRPKLIREGHPFTSKGANAH